MRMLVSDIDIVVTLLKCRVTRSKQTELIRILLKKAILPIRDGLMMRLITRIKKIKRSLPLGPVVASNHPSNFSPPIGLC